MGRFLLHPFQNHLLPVPRLLFEGTLQIGQELELPRPFLTIQDERHRSMLSLSNHQQFRPRTRPNHRKIVSF